MPVKIETHHTCAYPGCTKQGWITFRGKPHSKYCVAHFKELKPRIAKLNSETAQERRLRQHREWVNRRNEEEDNTPAEQPRPW